MDSLLTAADTPPKGVHFTADSAIAIKDAGAQLSLLCDELLANTEQVNGIANTCRFALEHYSIYVDRL